MYKGLKYTYIYDNIHGYIELSLTAKRIIDTRLFQRLRHISQTGALNFKYPTAIHKRFEHSIGTYHLTGLFLSTINFKQPELNLSKKLIELVKIAGLCHDLGHFSFSHLFDDIFYNSNQNMIPHEKRSILVLKEILKKYPDIDIDTKDFLVIKDCILPEENEYDNWKDEYKVGKFILNIVSNEQNGIDVDKFDYLARDNFHSPLKLGFNFDLLINNSRIIDDTICYNNRIVNDIYHLYFVRYRLHRKMYKDNTVVAIEYMLSDILNRINEIDNIHRIIDKPKEYLRMTDNIIYNYNDEYIENLLERIETRDLYNFINEVNYKKLDIENINNIIKLYCQENNIDMENIIVNNSKIGYISGNKSNPLDNIYLFDLLDDKKYKAKLSDFSELISPMYQENILRLYVKDKELIEHGNNLWNKIDQLINVN